MSVTPEYKAWDAMIYRCASERCASWPNYGGRGIRVCERWTNSFTAFLADMGRRPSSKHSIDRIDTNGHYEPGNCRWATKAQQTRNRRAAKLDDIRVTAIRRLLAAGVRSRRIAPMFGVTEQTICDIKKGRIWAA